MQRFRAWRRPLRWVWGFLILGTLYSVGQDLLSDRLIHDLPGSWQLIRLHAGPIGGAALVLFVAYGVAELAHRRCWDDILLGAANVKRAQDLAPTVDVSITDYRPGPQFASDVVQHWRDVLLDTGGVVILGKERSGKSRLAWEILRGIPNAIVVMPRDLTPPLGFASNGLRGNKVILFIDDLHRTPRIEPRIWRERLARASGCRCLVVCTVEDGVMWQEIERNHADLLADYGGKKCLARTDRLDDLEGITLPGGSSEGGPRQRPGGWGGPVLAYHFAGRDDELRRLREGFTPRGDQVLVQALHGLPGVGKTQLAKRFALAHRDDYDLVLWVRAGEPAQLVADYVGLAAVLGTLDGVVADQDALVEAVRTQLEAGGKRWLLVFDDALEPGGLERFVPRAGGGHVLVTSRDPAWRSIAAPFEVSPLCEQFAVEFLLSRTGRRDEDAAAQLARTLGCLPLALEQAAAYIEQETETFTGYLSLFPEDTVHGLGDNAPATDYQGTVAGTFSLAIQKVASQSERAQDLLKLFAFLAPDAVPLEMLRAEAACVESPVSRALTDDVTVAAMVGVLRRYSLVQVVDDQTIDVHGLIQLVVREAMTGPERRKWAEAAVSFIDSAFPRGYHNESTWSTCERLLPHALATTRHLDCLGGSSRAALDLVERGADYLQTRGLRGEARMLFASAVGALERAGPDDRRLSRLEHKLGAVAFLQGDLDGARKHYERSIETQQRVCGPDDIHVATTLGEIAKVLHSQGDLDGARALTERVLSRQLVAYHPEHLDVGFSLYSLASILASQGEHQTALVHARRALTIAEKTRNWLLTEWSLLALGNIHESTGNLSRAVDRYRERWRFSISFDRPSNHVEAWCLNDLARLAVKLGRAEAGLRLKVANCVILGRIGHADAETDLEQTRAEAESLGMERARFEELMSEVEKEYERDRARGLVEAAFGPL